MAQIIEMQCKQSDGSYETLLPKSQASLLEINNTDLGSHLGGNTTVEGSLDYLSRMYAYWWKREIRIPVYTFSQGSYRRTKGIYYVSGVQYQARIEGSAYQYAGNTLGVNSAGNIYIKDQVQIYISWSWPHGSAYFSWGATPNDGYFYWIYDGEVCQLSQGSSKAYIQGGGSTEEDGYVYMGKALYNINATVTSYEDGGTDYVYSFSRDTYPDSGTVGNYTYTYLGIPFENAMKDGPK